MECQNQKRINPKLSGFNLYDHFTWRPWQQRAMQLKTKRSWDCGFCTTRTWTVSCYVLLYIICCCLLDLWSSCESNPAEAGWNYATLDITLVISPLIPFSWFSNLALIFLDSWSEPRLLKSGIGPVVQYARRFLGGILLVQPICHIGDSNETALLHGQG